MRRRGGGGIVPSSYIHKALQLMGTGKLEKSQSELFSRFYHIEAVTGLFFLIP